MATVTTKLTMSTNDALSDSLNLSVLDVLTTTVPAEMSRVSVLHSAPTVLQPASTGTFYLYVKNIGTNSRFVDIRIADDSVFASLAVGEFCFIPMKVNVGIELLALVGTEVVEYAYFKKA
jgi:hypothetical protein|tara:strand:- start:180 stop:539 length:360 start_codon:yes stop_codon:yes gene_type:complete